jgi:hypothetical protein
VWRSFWQISGKDPCVVVYATNTGAIVPATLDTNDWHLRCIA